ncbi:hypothetical protein PMAYCL1PPCAC_21896, partial [Pristionchus mayeri]
PLRSIPIIGKKIEMVGSRLILRHLSYGRSACASINKAAMQRTVVDGEADVTSLNILTGDRMVVRLSAPDQKDQKSRRFRRLFNLPKDAINGLREAIVKSGRKPKQLQNEADQLTEKIINRRFPASPEVLKDMRNKIRLRMKSKMKDEDDEMEMLDHNLSEIVREERERKIKNAVDKELKKNNFSWKPMEASSDEGALAYALARLAPNYAEVARVLEELHGVDWGKWAPKSVLDFGAGAGGAFWALNERYGDSMREYTAIEANDHSSRIAMDIMRLRGSTSLVHGGVLFRRHLVPSLQTTYDLVIVHRTLIELASQEARFQLMESLWRRTNRFLILIESGLEDSFSGLMEVRNFLLTMGIMMDKEKTEELLKEHGKWNALTARLLNEKRISDYERYEIIRDQLPSSISPPTMLPPATVVAPCPHDRGCPKQMLSEACTLNVTFSPLRVHGTIAQANDDRTETSAFSYMILEKGVRGSETESLPRILKIRNKNQSISCQTCTALKGLQVIWTSKRAGDPFNSLAKRSAGDVFPFHAEFTKRESSVGASAMNEMEEEEEGNEEEKEELKEEEKEEEEKKNEEKEDEKEEE